MQCELVTFADDMMLVIRVAQLKRSEENRTEELAKLVQWAEESSGVVFVEKRTGQETPTFKMREGRVYCKDNKY